MAKTIDASDFIKPYEEPPEEMIETVANLTPFDFIKSISNNKKDLLKDDSEAIKQYAAFIVNRGLGYFPDTVLSANEMNMYPSIPARAQYYYYMSSIRKGNRFSKWFKAEQSEELNLIQQVYNVRRDVAKQYLKLLSKENLQSLRELVNTGETKTPKKSKKNK
jgi:hypothetical protein